MPPLPRGRCLVCGADVALRKGQLIREHRDPALKAEVRRGRLGYAPVCPGSGKRAQVFV